MTMVYLSMKEVAISEFKAKCLSMLEEVEKTKQPLRITRFSKPIAEAPAVAWQKQGRLVWLHG